MERCGPNSSPNHSQGPVYDAKGNYYAGEWDKNKRQGFGSQVNKEKNLTYTGYWKNNKRSGHGELSYIDSKNCYIYSGTWKNNKRSGYGINYYEGGGRYEGEWRKGMRSGFGRMDYRDGSTYFGFWLKDIRSGHGHMLATDDSIYVGNWVNDMKSGVGILTTSSNDVYEGHWRCNMKHGEGRYSIFDTGLQLRGVWLDDVPRTATIRAVYSDAPHPMEFELPPCTLKDPKKVIERARAYFLRKGKDSEENLEPKE